MAAPFAGALTPQVVPFTPPSATPGDARHVARLGQPAGARRRRDRWSGSCRARSSASVAYVVSRGLHLPIFVDANLAPSTTTKSYDILSSSGNAAQTYTVPFYTQPHQHQHRRNFRRLQRRQFLVQLDGDHGRAGPCGTGWNSPPITR